MTENSDKIVLFDGVCNLCNASVQFLIRRDRTKIFKFASLQSGTARKMLESHHEKGAFLKSIVFLDNGQVYYESDAVLRICRYLGWPWKGGHYLRFFPRWLRDGVYRWVARNRYRWFGKKDQCMVPAEDVSDRFLD